MLSTYYVPGTGAAQKTKIFGLDGMSIPIEIRFSINNKHAVNPVHGPLGLFSNLNSTQVLTLEHLLQNHKWCFGCVTKKKKKLSPTRAAQNVMCGYAVF